MSTETLKNIIKKKYKNQENLSREIGISSSHITRILNKKDYDYNFKTIIKIAEALNISILSFILKDEKYFEEKYIDIEYLNFLSKNAKKLRKEKKLSQKKIAELSHISLRTYSSIEGNIVDNLKISTILKLSKFYNISLKKFLFNLK